MIRIIDYIEITFENLDFIRIPAGYFTDVKIGDIDLIIRKEKNGLEISSAVVNTLTLKVKQETDKDAATFDGDIYSFAQGRTSLFERLDKNDISSIDIVFSEDERYELRVAWEDADDYHNRYQSTEKESDGGIIVRIENTER